MDLYRRVGNFDGTRPILVLGLEGWIDAGIGAAAALAALLTSRQVQPLVEFESDELLDHRSRRPVMHIASGVNHGLTWPTIQLRAGRDDGDKDMLFLVGPEPDLRWRAFVNAVVELTSALDVRMVVGLGAFPAPVPHTRPVRLVSTSPTRELAEQVGYMPHAIDVPAGIHGALEEAFGLAGVPAVGLWARVPHYVAAMPYPAASAALIDGLASVGGLALESRDLHESAARTRVRIDELIANSDEHRQLVAQLEAQAEVDVVEGQRGSSMDLSGQAIPSGEEIAAELERFLRGESGG
jgi:hypothetical protein